MSKIPEPTPTFMHTSSKTLILLNRPFDKPPVKNTEDSHQLVNPELAIVIDPTPNFGIENFGNVRDITLCPEMKFRFSENLRDLVFTFPANCAVVTKKHFCSMIRCWTRLKTKSKKIKLHCLELVLSVVLFTVNNFGLLLIQF